MTAFNSNIYTAQNDGITSIDTFQPARDVQGRVRVMFATQAGAAYAQGDTINIGRLPSGSRVLAVLIQHAALGASVTLAVTGNDGSSRTLVAAYDASGAINTITPSAYRNPLLTDTDLVATLEGANPTDSVVITFCIIYVRGN